MPKPTSPSPDNLALPFTPIHRLAEKLRAGDLTAAEIVACYLDRIAAHNEDLRAFVDVYDAEARAAAELADQSLKAGRRHGPLHGVPIALKDLIEIEGRTTTGGSLYWSNRISALTATLVRRLESAGMIVLGKTHMVEFAFGSWGTNSTMGTPRNPWDARRHRVPGGSSSGSGVAVAAGLAPAAIGSDTGGSIRIPASLCGIVGLKTTVGRVSNHGTLRLSATFDTLGPMARDVQDAALLFEAMHGPDPNDPETLAHPPTDVFPQLKAGVTGLRLAVLPDSELAPVDGEVLASFARSVEKFRELGAHIDTLALPESHKRIADLAGKLIAAEGYALHRQWIDRDDLPFDPDVRDRIRWAKALSAADYIGLNAERARLQREFQQKFSDFDALLLPTTPLPATPLSEVDQSKAPMSVLTRLANLLGLCALAVPNGFNQDGLPTSLQIVGKAYEEAKMLRIGWAYEGATNWHARRAPI